MRRPQDLDSQQSFYTLNPNSPFGLFKKMQTKSANFWLRHVLWLLNNVFLVLIYLTIIFTWPMFLILQISYIFSWTGIRRELLRPRPSVRCCNNIWYVCLEKKSLRIFLSETIIIVWIVEHHHLNFLFIIFCRAVPFKYTCEGGTPLISDPPPHQ